MPLESTMLCLDNSDWMRNGDYLPSRLDAQQDAANILCTDRINSNPENTVGILTMAGKGVDLLVSPTEESGKVLAAFAHIKIGGKTDLSTAIQIAQLALKHRKNKNGAQRIIAFVGSPVTETAEVLQKLGKQLKKNNVALDLVSFGEVEENLNKLQELVNATNASDNSHLITVPGGVAPSTALLSSPVMMGSTAAGLGGMAGGAGGENFDLYGGIDPSLDPELAMAIRVSTEEARAQEEARVRVTQQESGGAASAPAPAPSSSGGGAAMEEDSEEALMQRALEMSMRDFAGAESATARPQEELDEDEELARALAMSMEQEQSEAASSGNAVLPTSASTNVTDPAYLQQLLGTTDLSDPMVQAALAQLQQAEEKKESKEGDGEGGSRKRKNDS